MGKPLPAAEKAALRAEISVDDRTKYFAMSTCPITSEAEQRMEQISSVVCKEIYNDHWESGHYTCSRCGNVLYCSDAKFVGPCMWPSFRKPAGATSLRTELVPPGAYNKYTCEVHELYCGS